MSKQIPQWKQVTSEEGKARVKRLQYRYDLLKQLLEELHASLPEREPELAKQAPPVEVYLDALDDETEHMSLEKAGVFVDEHLGNALTNLPENHQVKQRLRKAFREGVARIIPLVVAKIQMKESFDDILNFMAETRNVLAETVCDVPSHKFGKERIVGPKPRLARTHFTTGGRFVAYLDTALALVPKGYKSFVLPPAYDVMIGPESLEDLDGITMWASFNDQKIPVSTLLVCWEKPSNTNMDWLFGEFLTKETIYPTASMIHTDAAYIPAMRTFCRELFEKINEEYEDQQNLVNAIAELQWYLAHAMIYTRGSAAIAEWLCRALFVSKGYDVSWSKQPDLQALMRPNVHDFIRDYSTFASIIPI